MVEGRYYPDFLVEASHEFPKFRVMVPRLGENLDRGSVATSATEYSANSAERARSQDLVECPIVRDGSSNITLCGKHDAL